MGRLLAELQAYMFWKVGIVTPPATVGATALAGFSSVNYWLGLQARRHCQLVGQQSREQLLENNISAVYFLDPPNVDECVDAGVRWRKTGTDKRVRCTRPGSLITRRRASSTKRSTSRRSGGYSPQRQRPLDFPFLRSAADDKITLALFPPDSWNRTFKDMLGQNVSRPRRSR